jgi:hypothetical protein
MFWPCLLPDGDCIPIWAVLAKPPNRHVQVRPGSISSVDTNAIIAVRADLSHRLTAPTDALLFAATRFSLARNCPDSALAKLTPSLSPATACLLLSLHRQSIGGARELAQGRAS